MENLPAIALEPKARGTSLEEIVIETQQVIDAIICANGEITPEIELMYIQLTLDLGRKVDVLAFVEKKLDSESEFFKKQAQYYQGISRALDKSRESIRERVKAAMQHLGYTEVLGRQSRFTLSKIKDRLILEEFKLSDDYKMVIQTKVPDKEKITADLEQGLEVEGARLAPNFTLRQYANKRGEK